MIHDLIDILIDVLIDLLHHVGMLRKSLKILFVLMLVGKGLTTKHSYTGWLR